MSTPPALRATSPYTGEALGWFHRAGTCDDENASGGMVKTIPYVQIRKSAHAFFTTKLPSSPEALAAGGKCE